MTGVICKKKNIKYILLCFISIVIIAVLINQAFFKPSSLNRVIATRLYKEPANVYFKDQLFYNYVIDAYNNKNGTELPYTTNLTDEQLLTITTLIIPATYDDPMDASGIEKLTSLAGLYFYGPNTRPIANLDLSNNVSLTELMVWGKVSNLDITKNTELTRIRIANPIQEEINLNNNKKLTNIEIRGSNLKSLDVSQNTALTTLKVRNNKLETINLTNNTLLSTLDVRENDFASIDLSKNTKLGELYIGFNNLTSLDISNNPNLGRLDISQSGGNDRKNPNFNNISSIDLSKNTNISYLNLIKNGLTSLDISNNNKIDRMIFVERNKLSKIKLYDDNKLDLSKFTQDDAYQTLVNLGNNKIISPAADYKYYISKKIVVLKNEDVNTFISNLGLQNLTAKVFNGEEEIATGNIENEYTLKIYDSSNTEVQSIPIYIGYNTNFNDYELYKCVIDNYNNEKNTTLSYSEELTDTQLQSIKSLTCNNKNITDSTGIEKLTSLTSLNLSENSLNNINLDSNQNLTNLDISNNNLTSLDISLNTNLTNLNISGNKFQQTISVTKNNTLDLTNYLPIKLPNSIESTITNVANNSNITIDSDNKIVVTDGDVISTNVELEHNIGSTNNAYDVEFTLKVIDVSSEKYDLTKDYIYVGAGSLNLDDITVQNCTKEIIGNKLQISVGSDVIYEWDIISCSSDKYDLSKDYVVAGADKLDLSSINTEGTIEENNNKLQIKYNDDLLQEWDVVSWSSDESEFIDNYLITAFTSQDLSKIKVVNGDVRVSNYEIQFVHNDEVVASLTPVNISSTTYTGGKDYVYTGNSSLDLDSITVTIGGNEKDYYKAISGNQLLIMEEYYQPFKVLDIVRYSSAVPLSSEGYVGGGVLANLDFGYISVTNGTKEVNGDKLQIKYNDDVLKEWDILGYMSDTYNFTTGNYLFVGKELDLDLITTYNCEAVVEGNYLKFMYNNSSLKIYTLVTYESDKYNLKEDYINVGTGTLNLDDITVNNASLEKNDNKLQIKADSTLIKEWDIVSYSSEKYDLSKDYILSPFSLEDIKTVNCTASVETEVLQIKVGNEVIKELQIISYSSEVYDLSKDYIYLGNNEFDATLINTKGVSLNANNTKLEIKYDDEVLKTIKLISISSNEFTIADGKIFTGKTNLSIEKFLDGIQVNGLDDYTLMIKNGDATITTGNVVEGYVLVVDSTDYGTLDEYIISAQHLDFGNLNIDSENKIIKNIEVGTSINTILDEIDTSGTVSRLDKNGNAVSNDTLVKTGDIIRIKMSDETLDYRISVLGDVTGDGIVSIPDVAKLYSHVRKTTLMTEAWELEAGDLVKDENLIIPDVAKLYTIVRKNG